MYIFSWFRINKIADTLFKINSSFRRKKKYKSWTKLNNSPIDSFAEV